MFEELIKKYYHKKTIGYCYEVSDCLSGWYFQEYLIIKNKEKEKLKTYFILYGLLWFLGLVIAGALGYNKHVNGDATIFTAMDTVTHFGIFYWLYPPAWGTCLKWTFIYWIGIAMFLIYEQKFKHDMAGKESGSAKWNDTV